MIKKPKRSLRTVLIVSFLLFSITPLATITIYSLYKYDEAINQEQKERLEGNRREVTLIINEFESGLIDKTRKHSTNSSLIYYMAQKSRSEISPLLTKWLEAHFAHRITVFDREGQLLLSLFKDENGNIKRNQAQENKALFLSENFLKTVADKDIITQVEIRKNKSLDLVAFSKIRTSSGALVGYIEEIVELDRKFLQSLKNRMKLELLFFADPENRTFEEGQWPVVSSHDDLEIYDNSFFKKKSSGKEFFELTIRERPFSFLVRSVSWGEQKFYMAVGASREAVKTIADKVNYAFISALAIIILLLVMASFVISKILMKPLSDLIEVIQETKPGEEISKVSEQSEGELGQLVSSFNDMSMRVNSAQKELRAKVKELETANQEIGNAQTRLIHSAKMASLGQLVAGVAHELNNPIGFIYSNMTHLREYSDSLIKLVRTAETSPQDLAQKKKDVEFDYIVDDMPNLIQSCEDGARRTRDIVLGLRNFSRLEEVKLVEMNIEEELDNTLRLLSGELKNRIDVQKSFSNITVIKGYPSQLNQVFMNILSNAAQAIEGEGKITISTKTKNAEEVQVIINDTGHGMDTSTIRKIFDPFFTTKTLGKGTGLGLSISYGIIQKHGGDINVTSQKGVGTEFTITLPVAGPLEAAPEA